MTVENGGEQPANDTAVVEAEALKTPAETTEAEVTENTEGEEGGEEAAQTSDDVEVDYEGQKFKVPASIKDALLRQADYTRKTQELAEARKALEAQSEGVKGQAETQKQAHAEAVKVAALDDRLAEYEKVDWDALFQTNPELFHQHRFAREKLKEQRDTAARTLEQKQGELRDSANREYGNRIAKAQAELPKLIKDWSPELDVKLAKFGTGLGLSPQEITQATIQNPVFAKILHIAFQADEAAKKAKTQQTFEQSQKAQPVTRVGGNSGSANQRKTTDPSGDALSTEEWVRRERERLSKARAAR